MTIIVKGSLKPQATRLTFALLALVMISFGLFAQQYSQPKVPADLQAQNISHPDH